jgi:hypothetical protein
VPTERLRERSRYRMAARWSAVTLDCKLSIAAGVLAVLKFCLRNLRSCNADIPDWRDLRRTPLRWSEVAYEVRNWDRLSWHVS